MLPFTSTLELDRNPAPFTVIAVSAEPDDTTAGEMLATATGVGVGMGVGVGVGRNALLPPPLQPTIAILARAVMSAAKNTDDDLEFMRHVLKQV